MRNAIAITDDILEFDTTVYSDRRRFIGFKDEDAIRRAKDAYRQSNTKLEETEQTLKAQTEWNTESCNASLKENRRTARHRKDDAR